MCFIKHQQNEHSKTPKLAALNNNNQSLLLLVVSTKNMQMEPSAMPSTQNLETSKRREPLNHIIFNYLVSGRDNSSHNHPKGPLVWIHPQGTRRLEPINPQVMSIGLHTHLIRFNLSQTPYGIRKFTDQLLYTSLQPTLLANVKYFQHLEPQSSTTW